MSYSRFFSGLMAMFFVLLTFPAVASPSVMDGMSRTDDVVANVTVRGKNVAIHELGEIQAPNDNKGMDGFAERVSYVLHDWTKENGVEASGNICKTPDGKTWGIILLTMYAHTTSPLTKACPDGMVETGISIHSHPQRHRYAVNSVDRLFAQDGMRAASHISTYPDIYSPEDYERPGYLVGQIDLHFQNGPGTEKVIWEMNEPNPYPSQKDLASL